MSHIQFDVVRNEDGKVVFTTKGSRWDASAATKKFLLQQFKTKFEFSALTDGKVVFSSQDSAVSEIAVATVNGIIERLISPLVTVPRQVRKGDSGVGRTPVFTIKWTCLSRMSPRRPQHIIDAEKAAIAAKQAQSQARSAQWKQQAEQQAVQRVINARNRIINQINYAFSQGKSGTEPAAKFITCQHCDAPAAFVTLKHALPKGAGVLDEDIIDGAGCQEHINWFYSKEKMLCSLLEFFYDGVRQIAIKAAS